MRSIQPSVDALLIGTSHVDGALYPYIMDLIWDSMDPVETTWVRDGITWQQAHTLEVFACITSRT